MSGQLLTLVFSVGMSRAHVSPLMINSWPWTRVSPLERCKRAIQWCISSGVSALQCWTRWAVMITNEFGLEIKKWRIKWERERKSDCFPLNKRLSQVLKICLEHQGLAQMRVCVVYIPLWIVWGTHWINHAYIQRALKKEEMLVKWFYQHDINNIISITLKKRFMEQCSKYFCNFTITPDVVNISTSIKYL